MKITIGDEPRISVESGGDIPNGCVRITTWSSIKHESKELTTMEAFLLVEAISAAVGGFGLLKVEVGAPAPAPRLDVRVRRQGQEGR